jgi:hypothetical protein
MTKRTSKQIQKSLLEQYKVWRRGDTQGPEMGVGGGDVFGLGGRDGAPMQIDIGLGGARGGSQPSTAKPRVSVQQAKDMGIIKTEPKVWRRGEQPATKKPSAAAGPRVSQDKIPSEPLTKQDLTQALRAERTAAAKAQQEREAARKFLSPDGGDVFGKELKQTSPYVTGAKQAAGAVGVLGGATGATALGGYFWDKYQADQAEQRRRELRKPKTSTEQPVNRADSPEVDKPDRLFKEGVQHESDLVIEDTAKEKFLQRVIGPESGGKPAIKNPRSPATGLFQFMPQTWAGVVAKAKPGDPHYGVSFEEMPQNVPAQRAAARQIADEYARTIKRSGLPDIPTSYYLLHGHGPRAVEIYKNPDKQLKDIYPEYVRNKKGEMVKSIVYRQNPNFNPEQRLGDFVAKRAKQMGDKLTDVFPTATAGELPAQPAEKSKPTKSVKADKKTDTTTAKLEPTEQKPIGTLVQPDYSKYNVGDLGPLEKIGPGQWRSSKGKIVTDAPELENLPTMPKPESFTDKLKRVAPPALGGGGELVSQVFGDRKKSTAPAAAPVIQPEPKKTDLAYEPGTAEYDARMEKLQTAAGDKFSREREARLKAAAEKPADKKIELQRDQTGLVKAKRELSDFERAFAAARAEKGPGATFSYTDPRTGKTELKTTAYKGETPPAKAATSTVVPAAITPANTSADSVAQSNTSTAQSDQGLNQGEEIVNIPVTKSTNRAQDLERIIKQADEPVGTPAARTADELASDELWKDARSEWNALSQDEQQQRVRDAKLSQAGFDELAQTPELKESINTASHAELHDILRLAGRLK